MSAPGTGSPTAVTVGNFDGVHLGHVRLVKAARDAAGARGRVVVLSFDPSPIAVLRPGAEPPRLTDFDQRAELLRKAGADDVVRLTPSREFLSQSPKEFIGWLCEQWKPGAIIEGPDFRFGRGRAGSVQTLRDEEKSRGYRTIVVEPAQAILCDCSSVPASSSLARWLLVRGRVNDAARVLGRPYEVRCPVLPGDRRGRDIGVPTANLDHGDGLLPGDGIYAGAATDPDGKSHPAAISVGTKPTFGEHPRVCEAHLIGYDGPAEQYGWRIRLQFHRWLRDQLACGDVQSLVEQLRRDIERSASASPPSVAPQRNRRTEPQMNADERR